VTRLQAAAAILAALAALEALGQPRPVDVDVGSEKPQWGSPLAYWVNVTALRPLRVRVRVNVLEPGKGWSGWIALWEGDMAAGESRVFRGESSGPARLGSYVIWVSIGFSSPQDYQVIGGNLHYALYDVVHTVTVYDPSAEYWYSMYAQARNESEQLKRACEQLEAEAAALRANLTALRAELKKLRSELEALAAERARLQSENAALLAEKSMLEGENAQLRAFASKLEEQAKTALIVAALLAALAVALAAALIVAVRRGQVQRPAAPLPPPLD